VSLTAYIFVLFEEEEIVDWFPEISALVCVMISLTSLVGVYGSIGDGISPSIARHPGRLLLCQNVFFGIGSLLSMLFGAESLFNNADLSDFLETTRNKWDHKATITFRAKLTTLGVLAFGLSALLLLSIALATLIIRHWNFEDVLSAMIPGYGRQRERRSRRRQLLAEDFEDFDEEEGEHSIMMEQI